MKAKEVATATIWPTWRCDKCKSEFKFMPVTPVNENIYRKHPVFCPYCGNSGEQTEHTEHVVFTNVGTVKTNAIAGEGQKRGVK